MSQTLQTPETPAEPDMTVHDILAAKVYLPEFIKTCQAYGINPQNEDEVRGLLDIAQNIRVVEMQQGAVAAAEPTQIEKAAAASHGMLGQTSELPAIDSAPYLADPDVVRAFEVGGLPA